MLTVTETHRELSKKPLLPRGLPPPSRSVDRVGAVGAALHACSLLGRPKELKSPGGASGSLGSEQGGTFGLLMPPDTAVWTPKTPLQRISSGLEMLRLGDKTLVQNVPGNSFDPLCVPPSLASLTGCLSLSMGFLFVVSLVWLAWGREIDSLKMCQAPPCDRDS